MQDFFSELLTGSGAAVTALWGLFGALVVTIAQNIKENMNSEKQRLLDSIGVEQGIMDAIGVRARLIVERMNCEPNYDPSDYEIERALFEAVLDSSNLTFISYELRAINIEGRRWANKVVRNYRQVVLDICKRARNQRGQVGGEDPIAAIRKATSEATEQTIDVCRAVRDRKRILYRFLPSSSCYHSHGCRAFPRECSICRQNQPKTD